MSRIYFHTPERTVEVLGSERAYMRGLVADLALGALRVYADSDTDWFRSVVVDAGYDLFAHSRTRDFESWFKVGARGGLSVDGQVIPPADLSSNTVIAMGSSVLALLARLEGMCEDHAWVGAEDAEWFADLIDAGRASNIFRAEQGWEDVAELAREVASGLSGPIVTSYSVTEGFPNRYVIGEPWFFAWKSGQESNPPDEAAEERWVALAAAERWDLAVAGVKARRHNRQLSPGTQNVRFLSGATVFDLVAERWESRAAA